MARFLLVFLLLLVFACNNLEDATIPERQTFIRFFGSARSYVAVAVEPDVDGGFILVGNAAAIEATSTAEAIGPAIVVVKTNAQGTKVWEKILPDANAHSIKPLTDGYLLTGEGIKLNPNSSESSEFVNSQFLLLKLSTTGEPQLTFKKDSSVTVTRGQGLVELKVDFKANASVLLPGGSEVATLGSYKVPGGQERTITMGFSLNNFNQPVWRKNLDLFNFDYINTNFLGFNTGNLVWASTAKPQDANQSEYVSVITVPPNFASPSNNSLFGKTDDTGGHDVNDLEASATGFGIVGTYTSKAGNKNIFFVKVDPAGNVMESTVKYFDGVDLGITKTAEGRSQDEGGAITFTRDGGFVLACSMGENPITGNGGTDILLIKIDAFGNFIWSKLLGGSGDEVATTIREMSDGTLLISGTSTISNVSSMFIIRSDASGNLKD